MKLQFFIGRNKEAAILESKCKSTSAEFVAIYGPYADLVQNDIGMEALFREGE